MTMKVFTFTDEKVFYGINPEEIKHFLKSKEQADDAEAFLECTINNLKDDEIIVLVNLEQPHLENLISFCHSPHSFMQNKKQKPTKILCILSPNDEITVKTIKHTEDGHKSSNRHWFWRNDIIILHTAANYKSEAVNKSFDMKGNNSLYQEITPQFMLPIHLDPVTHKTSNLAN